MAVFKALVLLLSVYLVSTSSVNRIARQSDPGDTATVQFTLLSSYTSSCLEGLTPEGTNIHVDYRLIPRFVFTVGDWTKGETTRVNNTGVFFL